MKIIFFPILLHLMLINCQPKNHPKQVSNSITTKDTLSVKTRWTPPDTKAKLLNDPTLQPRIKKYIVDSMVLVMADYLLENLAEFKKVKVIGDINGDKRIDSVQLMPELIYSTEYGYEEGISVVFSDPKIPRIKVNSMCVNFDFLFPVGDIDEDGWMELGQYYTSCASRYKTLVLLRCNKKNTWKEVEYCAYDTYFPEPHISTRIRKIKKNQYEMTEITDDNLEGFGKLKKIVRYTIAD